MSNIKKYILIIGLSTIILASTLANDVKPVAAADPTSYDTYIQNWTGYRPLAGGQGAKVVNYNQVVANRGADSYVEAVLSTQVFNIVTDADPPTGMDEVNMGLVLSANGRYGINYNKGGPFSATYTASSGGTDTGIHCDDCGVWLDLPFPLVFFGAPAPNSGVYRKIWVSSNGFISVGDTIAAPSPDIGPNKPNGVIAPFWRDLNPAAGGRIAWFTDNSQNFVIEWNQVPTKGGNGAPQSFRLWIHDSTPPQSPYWQNWIEFYYGSITPGDGVNTKIGIEDQYGRRPVTFSQYDVSPNQRVEFKASSGPMYINSIKISIIDYLPSGARDSDASIIFDTSRLDGYNVMFASAADIPQIMPDFAKLVLGGADYGIGVLGLAVETPVIGAAGLLVGTAAITIDIYDYLVQQYWQALLTKVQPQENPADTIDARLEVTTRTGGVNILGAPVDTSLGAKLKWRFHDSANNVAHRLVITATVGYSDSNNGADIWSVQTSNTLDMTPSHKLFEWNFDGLSLDDWTATDVNLASGRDTWGVTSSCPSGCFEGTYSVWSAQDSDGTPSPGRYDNNMNAQLSVSLPNMVGYSQLILYFKAWVDTEQNYDFLYVDYFSGGLWSTAATYSGPISTSVPRSTTAYTQWMSPRLTLPTSTTSLRFRFVSNGAVVAQGAYVDHIVLFGNGAATSYDVTIKSKQNTGAALSAPVSMDGGASYSTPAIFLTSGQHTFTVPNPFVTGTRTYQFLRWDDSSTSPSRTINVASNPVLEATYQLAPADFSITANPTSITILRGSTATSTITLTSLNAFSGTISLSNTSCPGGPVTSPNPSSVSVAADGTATSTLNLSTSDSTAVGACTVTVTGTSGSLSHQASITVTVQDFSISASPTSHTFQSGSSGTSTISLTSLGGFTGTVTLSAQVTPVVANGPTATFNPTSVTMTSGSGTSTLTLSTTPATPPGSYTVTVTGTTGPRTHSITISLTVTSDFTIAAVPASLTIGQGFSGTSTITLSSYGFSGTVTLSLSISPFVANGPTTSLSATGLTLNLGSSASSTLTISTTTSTPAGTYTVTVTGTSGSLSHAATVTVNIPPPDFSMTSTPAIVFVSLGSSGSANINLQANPSFRGTITLSAGGLPSKTSYTFNPTQLTLDPSQSGTSVLTISATNQAIVGSYTITVTGTSGSITHSPTITLKVIPSTITVSQTLTFTGITVTSASSFTVNTATGRTLTGSTTFTGTDNQGVQFYSGIVSMTLAFGDGGQAKYIANIPSLPYWLMVKCTIDVTNGSATWTILRTDDVDHSGAVNIIDLSILSAAYGSTPGSSNWNPAADLNADNAVNIIDLSIAAADFGSTVSQPPFTVSPSNPSPASFLAGSSSTSTTTVQSFTLSGTVSLTATISPVVTNGPTASFNPASFTFTSAGTGTSTLTISTAPTTPAGVYTITIRGTSGSNFHLVTITVTVTSDFTLSPSNPSLSLQAGTSGTETVTIRTYGVGFSGTLSASISPIVGNGPTVSPGSYSVSLSLGSTNSYIFTVYTNIITPQIGYTLTITGVSGGVTHTITVSITITPPPAAPTYVYPATFTAGAISGKQITVCQGTVVSLYIVLSSPIQVTGPIEVEIRKDIVFSGDTYHTTLYRTAAIGPGNTLVAMGPFTASDLTGGFPGNFRQYFIKVWWGPRSTNPNPIYDPTDPNTREWVQTKSCGGGGGGGGSIAHGSLITMEDGTTIPVQNLEVGDRMLGYDVETGQYTVSVVTDIKKVDTTNMLLINTEAGMPVRVDANPAQTLWVKRADGTTLWLSVTEVTVTDYLFTQNGWVKVTSIEFASQGRHVMYDIIATTPYFANGYLDPQTKL